jgi:hypothetical protein
MRVAQLQAWFSAALPALQGGSLQGDLVPVSGDASFRRYFRAFTDTGSWILVDAPPDREDSRPFIAMAARLGAGGVAVPDVLLADLEAGFMCLSDFGDIPLWTPLAAAQRSVAPGPAATALYQAAFAELLKIQRCQVNAPPLPPYDAALLLREMRLCKQWFCAQLLDHPLSAAEDALCERAFAFLTETALAQPQVFVHRDYHSRNLMFRDAQPPGVLDFQDAVLGPVTYDLVSLLKDCYIAWPREQVVAWALDYAARAQAQGILVPMPAAAFIRAFDLMGAQRHLKVLGIFSRLWLRDGKASYLRDIPLTLHYLVQVARAHAELGELAAWLDHAILPGLDSALQTTLRQPRSGGASA